MTHIDSLPNEMLNFVFSHLDFKELQVVQHVSEKWSSVVQSKWDSQIVLANNLSQFGKGYSKKLTPSDYTLEIVEKCSNLEVLFWTHQETMMCQNIFKLFSKCTQLKHLEVVWPYPYYIQNLSDLALMPSLKILSIDGTALGEDWCKVIHSLPNLEAFSKTYLTLRELHLLLHTKNLTALSTNKITGNLQHVLSINPILINSQI